MKKRWIFCLLTLLLLLTACGRGVVEGADIDLGTSAVYADNDLQTAVDTVMRKFLTWDGCELYSLTYAGDVVSTQELAYCNSLRKAEQPLYAQCVVFESEFRSPRVASGGWEADTLYTWRFYLARTEGGAWQLVTWGYG